MRKYKMSSNNKENVETLELQKMDYVASAAKVVLASVPFAGSLLVELAGTVIPNQRINRIVSFAKTLEKRLSNLEQKFVRSQLMDEKFTDLLEEGLRQASRSLSEERREYISSLISNSLSSKDIEYLESKHLLRILDELNDIEVIWLQYFQKRRTQKEASESQDKYPNILKPIRVMQKTPQPVRDKSTLQDSYKEHLSQLGLLERREKRYIITTLGKLLSREIGLIDK